MTEIKIDRTTLPRDGERVKWLPYGNEESNEWKEGTFSEGDDLFCEGFGESSDSWNSAFDVIEWESLEG